MDTTWLVVGLIPQQLVNGLTIGAVYALIALGYTMVYGVLQLINFAHGDLFMLGAMVAVFLLGATAPLPLGLALLALGRRLGSRAQPARSGEPRRQNDTLCLLMESGAASEAFRGSACQPAARCGIVLARAGLELAPGGAHGDD